jgi:ubiquinone biosynthesis protein COQ4
MRQPRGLVPRPIRPLVAMRAMRTLLRNPDDTAQVFHIIRALSGNSFERMYQRTLADPVGARILGEHRDILPLLKDREALRALPDGTLGREYARFLDAEGLDAEGLVEASNDEDDDNHFLDERAHVLSLRMRDTHDLWHVAAGYHRDLFGEAALLAFTYAQGRNHGIGFIVAIAMLKQWMEGHPEALRLVWQAYRRGKRAKSFICADWEALLPLPLAEVRRRLDVEDVPTYAPLFSAAAAAAH